MCTALDILLHQLSKNSGEVPDEFGTFAVSPELKQHGEQPCHSQMPPANSYQSESNWPALNTSTTISPVGAPFSDGKKSRRAQKWSTFIPEWFFPEILLAASTSVGYGSLEHFDLRVPSGLVPDRSYIKSVEGYRLIPTGGRFSDFFSPTLLAFLHLCGQPG